MCDAVFTTRQLHVLKPALRSYHRLLDESLTGMWRTQIRNGLNRMTTQVWHVRSA